jgi:long-chain acyl-CoA synthetase
MVPHDAVSMSLATVLEHYAGLQPDRLAVVCGDTRLTYGQLDSSASQLAHGLTSLGIGPGDHVALSCPNLPYFPIAYFAILKVGAVVVPLNPLLKPREIAYHLRDSDARALVVFEGTPELPMARMARAACDEVPECRHLIVMTASPGNPSPVEGARTLGQLMHGRPPAFSRHPSKPDDTAVMLYTSGTTGQPKGAELTHFNMVFNAIVTHGLMMPVFDNRVDASRVTLITLPLFHSTGMTTQMNAGLYHGFTLVLQPRFDPAAVLEAMRRERVTYWVAVPTMYWALLQYVAANKMDLSWIHDHLCLCASGGAPMPVEVLRQFEATFGVRVLEGYGLSETSPVVCFNQLYKPSKPGTVGQPLYATEIRCVDDEDQPVPVGQRGEVVLRGHSVMKGYYKRPDATAEAMRNGWFHTGDIGMFDQDGYLAIVDRKKDLILRGGLNVYPRELEEVLMTHPAVSMVAVIGVPDERLGEEVKAFIVRKPGATATEAEIVDWCKEQFAAYKYPRQVEFRDALPVSPTGKLLKRELRASGA